MVDKDLKTLYTKFKVHTDFYCKNKMISYILGLDLNAWHEYFKIL